MTKKIQIHYVAMLKEATGCAEETINTAAATIRDLYSELAERYGFPWPYSAMRPGINENIAKWSSDLNDGDKIIFLPPPSGG